jgi:hypothetical protein
MSLSRPGLDLIRFSSSTKLLTGWNFFHVSKGSNRSGSNRSGSKGSKRGRKSYRKRDSSEFTEDELQHLENLKKNSLLQRLHFFRVFKEPTEQLRNWLYFFDGSEDRQPHGSELQRGLIQLWSTCIVAVSPGAATELSLQLRLFSNLTERSILMQPSFLV